MGLATPAPHEDSRVNIGKGSFINDVTNLNCFWTHPPSFTPWRSKSLQLQLAIGSTLTVINQYKASGYTVYLLVKYWSIRHEMHNFETKLQKYYPKGNKYFRDGVYRMEPCHVVKEITPKFIKNKINKRNRLLKCFKRRPSIELKTRISNLNFEIRTQIFR